MEEEARFYHVSKLSTCGALAAGFRDGKEGKEGIQGVPDSELSQV